MDTKSEIVSLLQQQGRALSMDKLIRLVRAEGNSNDAKTKAAVWALISESRVELTPQREIRAARAARA
jgi:hypothetical protein